MLSLQVRSELVSSSPKASGLRCLHSGCSNVRATTADPRENKFYCHDHVEDMPYVQDMLRRMAATDLIKDHRDSKRKFEEMCENDRIGS